MAKEKNTNGDIVYSAIYSVRSNQWKIQDNQYDLLKLLTLLPESYKDFTFDNLGKESVKTLTNDLVGIASFNKAVKAQAEIFSYCYGIKTNKIAEALNLALPLTTEENIGRILGGLLPPGYDNSIEKGILPILGAEEAYWGTSQPTAITTLLRAAYYTVTKEKFGSGSSSDESSIFHTFDLPASYNPTPGDIVASRTFSEEKPQASSLGSGGHAGMFLGADKGEIVTIAYNRDMPGMEGFGLEFRPFANSPTKCTFFLKRTDVDFIPTSNRLPAV